MKKEKLKSCVPLLTATGTVPIDFKIWTPNL
jgi:hypothetical protein